MDLGGANVLRAVRRFPTMMAIGAFMGISQGTFVLFGGRLESFKEEGDEFERKEILRRTTRTPLEETIKDLGESSSTLPFPGQNIQNANCGRNARTRIRGAQEATPQGAIRHRGQPRQSHRRRQRIVTSIIETKKKKCPARCGIVHKHRCVRGVT